MKTIDRFEGKYRFLSNYYPCKVVYEGIEYPTTEHVYQAAKTLDIEHRQLIAEMPTPGAAKKSGQIVEIREDWNDVKYSVMEEILWLKFNQPEFKKLLLETRGFDLVEGNTWHDNSWGDCSCVKCKEIPGTNWLGKILMDIRLSIMVNDGI